MTLNQDQVQSYRLKSTRIITGHSLIDESLTSQSLIDSEHLPEKVDNFESIENTSILSHDKVTIDKSMLQTMTTKIRLKDKTIQELSEEIKRMSTELSRLNNDNTLKYVFKDKDSATTGIIEDSNTNFVKVEDTPVQHQSPILFRVIIVISVVSVICLQYFSHYSDAIHRILLSAYNSIKNNIMNLQL